MASTSSCWPPALSATSLAGRNLFEFTRWFWKKRKCISFWGTAQLQIKTILTSGRADENHILSVWLVLALKHLIQLVLSLQDGNFVSEHTFHSTMHVVCGWTTSWASSSWHPVGLRVAEPKIFAGACQECICRSAYFCDFGSCCNNIFWFLTEYKFHLTVSGTAGGTQNDISLITVENTLKKTKGKRL